MVVAAWLAIRSSSSYTMIIFPDAFFCSAPVKIGRTVRALDGVVLLLLLLLDVTGQHKRNIVKDTYSSTSLA